jgi:hypothetical protein
MTQDVSHRFCPSARLWCILLALLVALGLSVGPYVALADDAASGTRQMVVGDESLAGRFDYPVDAAVDSQGNLYVL